MSGEDFVDAFDRIAANVETVVQGKHAQVRLALTCLLAGGHLLIEDPPGVGKTLLARCLAASFGVDMKRIQFTPDLLPSDITGTDVYLPGTGEREFRAGPVFASVVLADEINRATPRAQSALLEAMEERRVTVGGVTRPLPEVFVVVATQNPVDMDGTYPLPEAQLDRFLMRLRMGYPDFDAEMQVLRAKVEQPPAIAGRVPPSPESRSAHGSDVLPVETGAPVSAVTDGAELVRMIRLARRTRIAEPVYAYLLRITRTSRLLVAGPAADVSPPGLVSGRHRHAGRNAASDPRLAAPPPGLAGTLTLGASPRASVGLLRAAQVHARLHGRDHVWADDVKVLAGPVLAHRLSLTPAAVQAGQNADGIVASILSSVEAPR
jgi:MoxR-like ATPase